MERLQRQSRSICPSRPELKSKILTPFESEGMLDAHAICFSLQGAAGLIIATRMGLFGGDDKGGHWQGSERETRFSPLSYSRDIRVSPQSPSTLYACLSVSSQGRHGLDLSQHGSWRHLEAV